MLQSSPRFCLIPGIWRQILRLQPYDLHCISRFREHWPADDTSQSRMICGLRDGAAACSRVQGIPSPLKDRVGRTDDLSGGMARRVALARAIALDPMLVMYDEPFAGLDPISLGVIANLIRRLNDALGITSIVVTYDMAESFKVVDLVYFISEGVVVASGTPAEMMASQHPFVKQFVNGEFDGPVSFHYPAKTLAQDVM